MILPPKSEFHCLPAQSYHTHKQTWEYLCLPARMCLCTLSISNQAKHISQGQVLTGLWDNCLNTGQAFLSITASHAYKGWTPQP